MAGKKIGLSSDLIIHPGVTIADILEARNMTQDELAARAGVTQSFISSVINGKKDISTQFAASLEYALGVSKSFWLNLQTRYDTEVLEAGEAFTITDDERRIRESLKDIVRFLRVKKMMPEKESKEDSILSLRRALQVSNLENLEKISMVSAFRMGQKQHIDPYVVGAWIRICKLHEKPITDAVTFSVSKIHDLTNNLKKVMCANSSGDIRQEIWYVCHSYGIDFDIIQHFTGAPVQGFIYKRGNGMFRICMTIRQSFADIFWFSLFHEIGHIINGDLDHAQNFLDDNSDRAREDAANRFASNALLDQDAYQQFLMRHSFSPNAITQFAESQNVPPYIVVGRLQREEIIPYNNYVYDSMKKRYKWAESI